LDRYFAGHGYRAATVANGRQMREVLANHCVDLIVLDLMLTGDDGLTLGRNLRRRHSSGRPRRSCSCGRCGLCAQIRIGLDAALLREAGKCGHAKRKRGLEVASDALPIEGYGLLPTS
jgi:hypothetical protein